MPARCANLHSWDSVRYKNRTINPGKSCCDLSLHGVSTLFRDLSDVSRDLADSKVLNKTNTLAGTPECAGRSKTYPVFPPRNKN